MPLDIFYSFSLPTSRRGVNPSFQFSSLARDSRAAQAISWLPSKATPCSTRSRFISVTFDASASCQGVYPSALLRSTTCPAMSMRMSCSVVAKSLTASLCADGIHLPKLLHCCSMLGTASRLPVLRGVLGGARCLCHCCAYCFLLCCRVAITLGRFLFI